jgi:hypothetical protein
MATEFLTYLRLGLHHIADLRGYDHILFITALTAPYRLTDWQQLLWLVTVFTLGHSATLLLATLDLVRIRPSIVEPGIAATILVTGLATLLSLAFAKEVADRRWQTGRYFMAAGFGLIHGLGFSNFLRSLLGDSDGLAVPLFAFNVGLEAGQLLIVAGVILLGLTVERLVPRRYWVAAVSALVAILGGSMLVQRLG